MTFCFQFLGSCLVPSNRHLAIYLYLLFCEGHFQFRAEHANTSTIPSNKLKWTRGNGQTFLIEKRGLIKKLPWHSCQPLFIKSLQIHFLYISSCWQIRWRGQNNPQHMWHPLNHRASLGNIYVPFIYYKPNYI